MTQEGEEIRTPSTLPKPDEWIAAAQLLGDLLQKGGGCVSSRAFRQALEQKGVADARGLVVGLRYYDFDSPDEQVPRPPFRWRAHAKSFYSEERYAQRMQETEVEAERAEKVAVTATAESDEEAAPPERRRNRQEEGRLGTYVVSALENIYQSEKAPDEAPYVFDVHNDRPGTEYENVDLIAVHWRSEKNVEMVAVEVKLDFTPRLVQQARNYSRFADRVWLAVPVLAEAADASTALRDFDPLLFEHVVDVGLGILACRRRPGRSYEVMPVHWPRRQQPDPVEKEAFVERYRRDLESAGVVAPRAAHRYPKLV